MNAILLTGLILFCVILLLGSKIYRERKKNSADFKKDCLHSSWMHGACRDCGVEYKDLE